MSRTRRMIGLLKGTIDFDHQEARFTLSLDREGELDFVAKAGVIEQIISCLARMCGELRQAEVTRPAAAETVTAALVQRQPLHEVVLLQLITDRGVPYTFALPLEAAGDIADRLRTESARDVPIGRA